MPFETPNLVQLRERGRADLEVELGIGPLLENSTLARMGDARASTAHLLHAHLEWIARMALPDTAEGEYLERWANSFRIFRKPAVQASGTCAIGGAPGATVPANTPLQRSDGARFFAAQDLIIGMAGTGTLEVYASESGNVGDTPEGAELAFSTTVANVDVAAVVEAPGLTGGADRESDEALRERLLLEMRARPEGGSEADYLRWTLEVPEVTRAWVIPLVDGAGSVGVAFVVDEDPGSILPNAQKVQEVQVYLEDGRRPVGARVIVFAPVLRTLDPVVQLSPNTVGVQASVSLAIDDLLSREAQPGQTLLRSHINEAISNAPGEVDHVLVSPTEDVTVNPGELLVLGNPTWQDMA